MFWKLCTLYERRISGCLIFHLIKNSACSWTHTHRHLEHEVAAQVSCKAAAQIQPDTGHDVPRGLVLRLPLHDPSQRRFVSETLIEQLQAVKSIQHPTLNMYGASQE